MLLVSPLRRNRKCWLTKQAILWSHNLSNHSCHLRTKNFPKCYISNCNFINRVSVLAGNLTYHLLMENRRLWQKQLSLNTRNCLCRKLGDKKEDYSTRTLLREGERKRDNCQQLSDQLAWHSLSQNGKQRPTPNVFLWPPWTCCST